MKNPISKISMQKNKISGVPAQIGIGAGIENSRYGNKSKLKSQSDVNAELFSDISDSFSRPGDRPRGAWRNLGAGIAKGMEYGARSQGARERKEDYDKYDRVMDYFQQANNSAMEQNAWYETREAAKKKYMPYALAYLENMANLDPVSRKAMYQHLVKQYGNEIGENFDVLTVDSVQPSLSTVKTEDGIVPFDLTSLFANDELLAQRYAMKTPEYLMSVQQERADKQQEYDQKERELRAKYPNYGKQDGEAREPEPFEFNGNSYEVVPLAGLEKTEKSDYGKAVNKAVYQIPTNENAIKSINDMKDVFERNPNIGESWVNMLSSGEDEDTWGRWIAKKFVSRQERADMEILKKASADLNLSTVLSVPGKSATDLLKRAINAASPTGTLTKIGFDKIADEWEHRAMSNIDMARAQAHARAQGKMIVQRNKAANVMGEGAQEEGNPWASLGRKVQ